MMCGSFRALQENPAPPRHRFLAKLAVRWPVQFPLTSPRIHVAKNQNTFEKRRREMEKKRKAHEKRERRRKKKEEPDEQVVSETSLEETPDPAQ
jgi:hypothetical protein